MIALISPAKKMLPASTAIAPRSGSSTPRFMEHTRHIVSLMSNYSAVELAEIFKISDTLAKELRMRFAHFFAPEAAACAVDCYDGVVYKHFKDDFSQEDEQYLQHHLRISSLLYGTLRPLDTIMPYRMEGFVRMAGNDERVDRYWRDIQTAQLIEDANSAGGELIYLASKEEQNAYHWKEVKKSVKVIEVEFLQRRGDKLRQVVVYTKMARGEMLRYMITHRLDTPEALKAFEWSGYRYNDTLSTDKKWVWVMEA